MRLESEACLRNRGPIWEVLRARLPAGLILEIASGTGMHAAWFGTRLLDERAMTTVWQPSDPGADARGSITAWCAGLPTVRPPLELDVEGAWPAVEPRPTAIFCANMVHIAPWSACLGLWSGAAGALEPGGMVFLYGPFRRGGYLAESNLAFDRSLRARDPRFGVRDLEAVEAAAVGFVLGEVMEMPANNLLTVWVRT